MSEKQQGLYVFTPTKDISLDEFVDIFKLSGFGISEDLYDRLDEDRAKHFTKVSFISTAPANIE